MIKDAEVNAEADKTRRELVETKNSAESLIANAEKDYKDNIDSLSEDVKNNYSSAKQELEAALSTSDVSEIKEKISQFTQTLAPIYNAAAEKQTTSESTDETVVDATYTEDKN
jgi:molecular chaperone DnaK